MQWYKQRLAILMPTRTLQTTWLVVLLVGAVLTVGCFDSNPYRVVPVSGRLTLNGKPVGGVRITFNPADGRASSATTNAKGEFEPWYRGSQNGVQVGTHQIVIEKAETDEILSAKTSVSPELASLMKRFGHGGTEKFEIEIKGATDDLVIDLPAK